MTSPCGWGWAHAQTGYTPTLEDNIIFMTCCQLFFGKLSVLPSFEFYGRGRFARAVVEHAVDTAHLVDDTRRDP